MTPTGMAVAVEAPSADSGSAVEQNSTPPAAELRSNPAPSPTEALLPRSVPAADSTHAVITVKVGGTRTGLNAVSGVPGVTLRLYDGTTAPNASPRSESWASCVSAAAGDCSFVVPTTQTGGANRDARYWIKQAGPDAPGTFSSGSMVTGTSTSLVTSAYQVRTGAQLRAGTIYRSTADFMVGTSSADTTSGGIWQTSLTNPAVRQDCGLNIALVMDLSGSVSPYIADLRASAKTFVDALTGTPSSVALYTFAAAAPAVGGANLASTPVSTLAGAATVKSRIDTYTTGGGTNWDRGLYQVAADSAGYDVAVVITDGNPTYYADAEGSGSRTRFREVENGVFSANAIKAEGTRVVVMGVGAGVSGGADNLRAISGPTINSDYYQTSDYAVAGAAMRQLALSACAGSVSIVKQLVPSTSTGESITGAVPAGGWTFEARTNSAGVGPATQNGTTVDGTGAVNFPLTFGHEAPPARVTIAETQQPGHTLVTQGGKRAVCVNVATGATIPVTNNPNDPNAFSLDVASSTAASCRVYNRPPEPVASITVAKRWIVNGAATNHGSQLAGLDAQLTLNGTAQPWSTTRAGLTPGTVSIAESTTFTGRELCTLTSSRVTAHNGSPVDAALPYAAALAAGDAETYTVTNTVECAAQLTLVKQVQGGAAAPTEWTLGSVAPAGAIAGPSGTTGAAAATAAVTPGARYALVESGGNPLYAPSIAAGATLIAPATGSWMCVQVSAAGSVIPGFTEGADGSVAVPLGQRVRCTVVNQTATLVLSKQVQNDNGGTRVPADWTLTASPRGGAPAGVAPQSVAGSATGTAITVRPGTTYDLSETGPGGYTQRSLRCTTGPGGAWVAATSVRLEALSTVSCEFVNDDDPARLTLVKRVVDAGAGGEAATTDWTLTAAGPTTISGVTGAAAVTGAKIPAGAYALGEAGGRPGYAGSAWTCEGGSLSGAVVTLGSGESVVCTIVNTAIAPRLTLIKQVENGTTGGTAIASDWILDAVGPTTVTGRSGTAAATDQTVTAGTYRLSERSGPDGYRASAWQCTGARSSDAGSVTLRPGDDATCTIVNTAQPATLTLEKTVENRNGGSLGAGDFPLTAAGPGGTFTGVSGSAAVTAVPVARGAYSLSEGSADPIGYGLTGLTCTIDGRQLGTSASQPTIELELGDDAVCRFVNADRPSSLTLVKEVADNGSGTTKTPADWTLTATPRAIDGQRTVTGNGTGSAVDGGVEGHRVFAGEYTLSESGPAGFAAGEWVCEGGVVTGGRVIVPNGGVVICTITNTATSPLLTLVKTVENGDTEGTATAADWTLTATGPTPISGASGSRSVTAAPVRVGVYTLGETGAPVGYTASAWQCEGGSLDGDALTLAEGEDVTCAVVNTAQPSEWTVTKSSDPSSGGSVNPGDVITYTLRASHTGGVLPVGVAIPDDLSDVLDDADMVGAFTASAGSAAVDGTQLTWTLGSFTGVQTLTYSVRVHDDAVGATLRNVVTPRNGISLGGQHQTVHVTPAWSLWKSSDPAPGAVLVGGTTLTYTLHALNTGPAAITSASARDDLSGVLGSGLLVTPLADGLVYDPDTQTLVWSIPDLAPGDPEATVSYAVTVNATAAGNDIVNAVTPSGVGGSCPPAGAVTACETSHRVASVQLSVAKTHAALPSSVLLTGRGNTVDYVVTLTNTGLDTAVDVVVEDVLPAGLSYVADSLVAPAGWTAAFVSGTLTATKAEVGTGETAEFRYRVVLGALPDGTEAGVEFPLVNTACESTASFELAHANQCASDAIVVMTEREPVVIDPPREDGSGGGNSTGGGTGVAGLDPTGLAATGSNVSGVLIGATALLLAGAAFVVVLRVRRRKA